jgi:hypothetical protein
MMSRHGGVPDPGYLGPRRESPRVHFQYGATGLEGNCGVMRVFDCGEDLMMLSDEGVGTNTALDNNSSAVLNKSVARCRLTSSSSWILPTPATGTRGRALSRTQKRENRACRLQVVSDGSCTSCLCAGSAGRTREKRCTPSLHRASEAGG